MSRPLAGLLGVGAVHVGELRFDGPARIDGTVEGTVRSTDLVEVGPTGTILGVLAARQALVAGVVRGAIEVTERITLLETAEVEGDLTVPWLDVRLGARWQGMVRVVRHRESP
jgi:cytoskeletal protein CcmA (bactofilin family)